MPYWLLDVMPEWALPYAYRVTPYQWWVSLNIAFFAFVLIASGFSFYCFMRARGYVWYQGRFRSPDQWQAIVQELYSGVREGRVPDHKTMLILDRYIYGRRGSDLRNLTKQDYI